MMARTEASSHSEAAGALGTAAPAPAATAAGKAGHPRDPTPPTRRAAHSGSGSTSKHPPARSSSAAASYWVGRSACARTRTRCRRRLSPPASHPDQNINKTLPASHHHHHPPSTHQSQPCCLRALNIITVGISRSSSTKGKNIETSPSPRRAQNLFSPSAPPQRPAVEAPLLSSASLKRILTYRHVRHVDKQLAQGPAQERPR